MSEMTPHDLMPQQVAVLDQFETGYSAEEQQLLDQFAAPIGAMAVGEKIMLTPQDEIVTRDQLKPVFGVLNRVLHSRVVGQYREARGEMRYLYSHGSLGGEDGFQAQLIGSFRGRLSNLELTRLSSKEEEIDAFFSDVKRRRPTVRSAPPEFFNNYLISIDKKSGGRPLKKAVGRLAYYAGNLHSQGMVYSRLHVVEDKTALDLQNAVDTARMLESVQVINTLNGGAVSPK